MKYSKIFKLNFLVILITLFPLSVWAQVTADQYHLADSAQNFNKLVFHAFVRPVWINETNTFWYAVDTRKGKEYFLVDAIKLKKKSAIDLEKLSSKINEQANGDSSPSSLQLEDLVFKNLDEISFTINNVKWSCNLRNYKLTKIEDIKQEETRRYWGEGRDELSNDPVMSPDNKWSAYIQDYNVYIKMVDSEEVVQLSFDGNNTDYYSSFIQWSPDSEKLATFKVTSFNKRFIQFIESSPEDQLQPKLHKRVYQKPGDVLPIRKPSLFDLNKPEQIFIESQPFLLQYNLSRLKWRKDSRGFTFEYNQRGHQVYQIVEVNGSTGETRIIIDERSDTFINYSGKRYRYDVNDGREIIWASERDGWNHLYLFDGKTATVKNQVTSGDWVVGGVDRVDENKRQLIFRGSGKNPGEDPYLIHYYKINFDGSGLIDLTPENANHKATFSENYQYFVDNYSRVDMPPITVLRNAEDGRVLMTLETADIADLFAKGWEMPEVFRAKGRDGETDIWGNIYRPTNFDSKVSYPIIEYIYAGPHSSFAQKSFMPYSRAFSRLSEMGFVIMQMDGMGTSNRSKAFHDVCWKNLKDAGLPDHILWIKAAANMYPEFDISNVGIFGVSAGGQSTMAALLWHPDFYKVGVSSCGSHDNRMDKIWWNEQWMGYPVGEHYTENSNVENAHKLQGQLMLIVGEVDDNVDPASTFQVADALIDASKEFEFVILPGVNHTLGGEYGERKRRDFFIKHILKLDPPNWNKIEDTN